jgi:hypothetical protein
MEDAGRYFANQGLGDGNEKMKLLKTGLFFTLCSGLFAQTFLSHLDSSELNGSVVTPAIGPAGIVVKNGLGLVNFAPGATGDGVYFTSCCASTNNAYYQFSGAGLAGLFDPAAGSISFSLTSRQSFASRVGSRYVFDVQDMAGTSRLRFTVQKISGRLVFDWTSRNVVGGYWYVTPGAEDQWFGAGVTLPVSMDWFGTTFTVKLGGKTFTNVYAPPPYSWSASSVFTIGARFASGIGSYACDDIIDEFSISGSAIPPPPPPPPPTVPPAFTTADAVSFTGGVDNTFTLTATGTPTPLLSKSGDLPPSVIFDSSRGTVSGIPTSLGVWPIVLTASSSAGTATQNFTLTVTPPPSASFNCTAVYSAAANNITITNCPVSSLVPKSALSNFSLTIQLSGIGVELQIDNKKFLVAAGSNP